MNRAIISKVLLIARCCLFCCLALIVQAGLADASDFNISEPKDAAAQFALGLRYYNGDGVAKDFSKAVELYRKAAEQGFAPAQTNLAWFYETGRVVAKNEVEAVKWWRKAAEQGCAQAQCCLGVCYVRGGGVTKDLVQAYKWLSLAVVQSDEWAKKIAKEGLAEIAREMTPKQIEEAKRLAARVVTK